MAFLIHLLILAVYPGSSRGLNCITCDSGKPAQSLSDKCVQQVDIINHLANLSKECNANPTLTPICYYGFYMDGYRNLHAIRGCEITGDCNFAQLTAMGSTLTYLNHLSVRCCRENNCNTMTATAAIPDPKLPSRLLFASLISALLHSTSTWY
ncbi:uncharacterized protein LOC141913254 [Tubulanus polymorphus]|uniref:uncharacterized protein LOC141913254 n=1 Tax=Tubulanus polymorphus TaxID=672921 RepID=UPI003DA52ABD